MQPPRPARRRRPRRHPAVKASSSKVTMRDVRVNAPSWPVQGDAASRTNEDILSTHVRGPLGPVAGHPPPQYTPNDQHTHIQHTHTRNTHRLTQTSYHAVTHADIMQHSHHTIPPPPGIWAHRNRNSESTARDTVANQGRRSRKRAEIPVPELLGNFLRETARTWPPGRGQGPHAERIV